MQDSSYCWENFTVLRRGWNSNVGDCVPTSHLEIAHFLLVWSHVVGWVDDTGKLRFLRGEEAFFNRHRRWKKWGNWGKRILERMGWLGDAQGTLDWEWGVPAVLGKLSIWVILKDWGDEERKLSPLTASQRRKPSNPVPHNFPESLRMTFVFLNPVYCLSLQTSFPIKISPIQNSFSPSLPNSTFHSQYHQNI